MFVSSLELSEEEEDLEDSDPEDDFVPKEGLEDSEEDSSGDEDIIDMDRISDILDGSPVPGFHPNPRSDQRPPELLAKSSPPPLRLACAFCSEVSASYSQQFEHLGELHLQPELTLMLQPATCRARWSGGPGWAGAGPGAPTAPAPWPPAWWPTTSPPPTHRW